MESINRKPGDRPNPQAWTRENSNHHSVHHERNSGRGIYLFYLTSKPIICTKLPSQSVQSQQLRKLQLARGGFGVGKDEHTSQRVQEIMVRLDEQTLALIAKLMTLVRKCYVHLPNARDAMYNLKIDLNCITTQPRQCRLPTVTWCACAFVNRHL